MPSTSRDWRDRDRACFCRDFFSWRSWFLMLELPITQLYITCMPVVLSIIFELDNFSCPLGLKIIRGSHASVDLFISQPVSTEEIFWGAVFSGFILRGDTSGISVSKQQISNPKFPRLTASHTHRSIENIRFQPLRSLLQKYCTVTSNNRPTDFAIQQPQAADLLKRKLHLYRTSYDPRSPPSHCFYIPYSECSPSKENSYREFYTCIIFTSQLTNFIDH